MLPKMVGGFLRTGFGAVSETQKKREKLHRLTFLSFSVFISVAVRLFLKSVFACFYNTLK